MVIDYIPRDWMVESKSLKLYLTSFRNHGAFHEACTMAIAEAADRRLLNRVWLRIGGYWYPRGGIPIDVFWQTGRRRTASGYPDQGGGRRIVAAAETRSAGTLIRDRALALGFDAVGFCRAELGD